MDKKVVFIFWCERLNELRGGVHRVILLLLKHLPVRGFDVHYLYTLDDYKSFKLYNSDIEAEEDIRVENLRDYLVSHNCNIIIGQDGAFSSSLTKLVTEMAIPGVQFVNEYHSSLLHIMSKLSKDYLRFEFAHNKSLPIRLGIILKYIFYPLWKKHIWRELSKSFLYNFQNSDITLLLTSREEPIVQRVMPKGKKANCIAIPNPLSWEEVAGNSILQKKKKEVLVVSRIYNPEKRIDLVLKIWRELHGRGVTKDWTLRIAGDGIHRQLLMQMSKEWNLENVIWEGWSEPKPYYQTASIFMMTSVCEGWGLTLTESMQSGVVPLAFDTYPALQDIITDGYDGYIIKPYDTKKYVDRMQLLMQDQELREQIAKNALISCQRFSTEKIMDMWSDMLHSL